MNQPIEDYFNGGDGYLTEDVMKDACGLPVRVRQLQDADGLGNILAGDQDSADETVEKDKEWKNLHKLIVNHMLDNDLDVMTFYEFKNILLNKDEHPNLSKEDIWDQLKDRGVVRPGLVRQKTSKGKPGAFIPMISFGRPFTNVCPQPGLEDIRLDFEEEHDVGLARKYAFSSRSRDLNAETMMSVYKALIPASKKGRRSAEQEEAKTKYDTLLRKLKSHEDSLKKLVSSHNRRLTGKKSVEEHEMDPANPDTASWNSMKQSRSVPYHYSDKQQYSVRARRYTVAGGAQSMSRRLQCHVVGGHTVDLDIYNCCLTLVQQIITKTKPEPSLPDDLLALLDDIVKNRSDFIKKLGLNVVQGKNVINTVFNGGTPPANLKNHELVLGLQKLSQYTRWMACNMLHQHYMSHGDNKQKTFPSATIMSLMRTSVEDMVLRSWTDQGLNSPARPKHVSLHFDGLRVSTNHVGNVQEYIKGCEKAAQEHTGFSVTITVKQHMSFIELVKNRGSHANALSNVPQPLLEKGNCIPCALWHVVPLSRPTIVAVVSDGSLANAEALKLKYRDYRSMAKMCSIDITCCFGLPDNHVKSYVIHYEGNGSPH